MDTLDFLHLSVGESSQGYVAVVKAGRYEGVDEGLGGLKCEERPNSADSAKLKKAALQSAETWGDRDRVSSNTTPRFLAEVVGATESLPIWMFGDGWRATFMDWRCRNSVLLSFSFSPFRGIHCRISECMPPASPMSVFVCPHRPTVCMPDRVECHRHRGGT